MTMIATELDKEALTEVLETALKLIVNKNLAKELAPSLRVVVHDEQSDDPRSDYDEWVKEVLLPHLDTRDLNIMGKLNVFSTVVTASCLAYCKGFNTAMTIVSLMSTNPSNP